MKLERNATNLINDLDKKKMFLYFWMWYENQKWQSKRQL